MFPLHRLAHGADQGFNFGEWHGEHRVQRFDAKAEGKSQPGKLLFGRVRAAKSSAIRLRRLKKNRAQR
ncbi:hypothetical protein [Oceanospirillum phage vB_OliS_GJ44]|nr:hypothetical protein [Oceanospirillum phage vB_OliS_GJ44]